MIGTKHSNILATDVLAVLAVLAVLTVLVLPLPAFTQAHAQETQTPPAETGAAQRHQSLVSKLWWNQEQKVKELALSEEQRAQMDQLLIAYLAQRQEQRKQQSEAFDAFGEALLRGDQNEISRCGDAIVEAAAQPMRRQVDMMIAVASVMTPEQREKLISLYPKLLSRQWIRSTPRAKTGPRRSHG